MSARFSIAIVSLSANNNVMYGSTQYQCESFGSLTYNSYCTEIKCFLTWEDAIPGVSS